MKNLLTTILVLLATLSASAQVGIGTTTPNAGSALDIVSTDKGILIPRLESTAVTSPVDGMMIYQPSDQSFYYYKGTAWTKIGAGVSSEMVDADGDTKIKLIESFRDNIVFSLDGTDNLKYEKSSSGSFRMELPNNNNNLAIGNDALFANTEGIHNHALGQEALFNNQEGSNNTAIGQRALYSNISGSNNTAIGLNALTLNQYGDFNTAIGLNALSSNVGDSQSGNHNVAIGREALRSNIGSYNVAIGDKSMTSNTEGFWNIAIGQDAMGSSTDVGEYNTAIGVDALKNNRGEHNIGIGASTLRANVDGILNIALGWLSLHENISGERNIGFGPDALGLNTTGSFNVAIGNAPLLNNKDGIHNVAIGSYALFNNESSNNIAIGQHAIENNITGEFNIALGKYALKDSENGEDNIAIGYEALLENNNQIGRNIAIGRLAGSYSTGEENIAIGRFSGANSSGNNNVFIGEGAGSNSTGNDRLYLENSSADSTGALIYGEFDNDMLRINNKLGIGTQSVGYPLSIKGDSNNDLIMLKDNLDANQWHVKLKDNNLNFVESGIAENRLVLEEGGNLGIGLANPNANLHIQSGSDPTLKIQSNGVDELSGRLSLRQSNETGVDIYYDGNSATDALVIQPYTSGIAEANQIKVALDGQLTIDNMQEVSSGDPVIRLPDGKLAVKKISIGDFIHGGIVFWLDESGEHGLVCALGEIAADIWGNGATLKGAIYDGMYSGKRNTDLVLTHNDPNLIAAKCALVMEANYGDWYMPSLEEVKQLRSNMTLVNSGISTQGGTTIGNEFYWSSKENGTTTAFFVNMGSALTGSGDKFIAYKTRAIRAF